MEKLFRNPIHVIQANLEALLEEPKIEMPLPLPKFEPTTDLSNLATVLELLPLDKQTCLVTMFSRMGLFFESGLLLSLHSVHDREEWTPTSAFLDGQYFELSQTAQTTALSLPKMKFGELLRASPHSLLAPLQLEKLCDHADAHAFAMKPAEEFLYLFFTSLPDPWLRPHVETIFKHINSVALDLL